MLTKLTATLLLFLLAGSAAAGTLDGCKLLSREDLEQLQVPAGATANPDWFEKDQLQMCKYVLGDTFKLTLAFGKPPGGTLENIKAMVAQMKNTPSEEVPAGIDAAFGDSGFCTINALPKGQALSCSEVRKDTVLAVVITRSTSIEPMKVSAASLLSTFSQIYSKLSP
jgi:hypothetical protein